MKKETVKPVKEKVKAPKAKVKAKPKVVKKSKVKVEAKSITKQVVKKPVVRKRQFLLSQKKATLAVKQRQTKWAPVWVILKKFGSGKRIHPSAITRHRRSWRRTKLHITPRRIRKWHMG